MHCLGIDIGGSFIKYAVIDDSNRILRAWRKPTLRFSAASSFYDYLCQDIERSAFRLAGVSAPGVIDRAGRVLSRAAASVEVMCGTCVDAEIGKRLNLPVRTLNDGRAAAYCELRLGNGRQTRSSAYWIIGTGIGGCLCQGERIVSGEDGIAGEFSHLPLAIESGRLRGIGSVASAKALLEAYNAAVPEAQKTQSGRIVCERYLDGEPQARAVMEAWCQHNVMGLYMLTLIYNPEVICIGGAISQQGWLIQKLHEGYYAVHSRFDKLITTRIVGCKYARHANVLGAVLHARDALCPA
ncbi:ROK family protein [Intestinirhabdus alba]|jgi:predicted NBD/HSP70 family sugar kinase|uniref:ROK family protein n=1 Tax=Intestinirhabdus alba TaxID=2899544 RepID=A0A6L6IKM8_9ENTR|nr:ROK family protein [Intestinirhabdus alba]MTH45263.1 ROK family protein [Intestinirhabdus alba]